MGPWFSHPGIEPTDPVLQGELLNHHYTTMVSTQNVLTTGPEVIKIFSCSTQLSLKFTLFINTKIAKINLIFWFRSPKTNVDKC